MHFPNLLLLNVYIPTVPRRTEALNLSTPSIWKGAWYRSIEITWFRVDVIRWAPFRPVASHVSASALILFSFLIACLHLWSVMLSMSLSMWFASFLTHSYHWKGEQKQAFIAPNLFPAATGIKMICMWLSEARVWRIPCQALLIWLLLTGHEKEQL